MVRKKAKGRLFFFICLAVFFLLGGPALAAEEQETLSAPSATLTAKNYVYNGEVQYVTLDSFSHPMESEGYFSFAWYKDGELLPYAANVLPIRFVSDSGYYYCKVTFTYNGKSTEKVTDTVEIKMEKMEVEIPSISPLIYTGYRQFPQVYENAQYRIEENFGAVNAGTYRVLFALKDRENLAFPNISGAEISEDGAYLSLPYTVLPAENVFSTPLSIPTCYEGRAPMPQAYAKFGEVRYRYFSDAAGVGEISPPSSIGTYYVQAVVDGSESVLPLASALLRFEIKPLTVFALRMESPPTRLSYMAFETVTLSGMVLVATMADGSVCDVSADDLEIIYPIGVHCLFAKDTHVLLSYGGALLPLAVSVSRAPLDLSGLVWSTEGWTYDGEAREITVSGLPPAVSVSGYDGNRITDAGIHTVTAFLTFDSENYDAPHSVEYTITVKKQSVPLPQFAASVYNGTVIDLPPLESSLYVFENPPVLLHAGTYALPLCLVDSKNYCFAGVESATVNIPFTVRPIELSVEIENVSLCIGERFSLPAYKIVSGSLLASDSLGFGAREGKNGIEYYFENSDYAVTYTGGDVERIYRLASPWSTAVFFLLIFIVLGVLARILWHRRKVRPAAGGAVCALGSACTYPLFAAKHNPPPLSSASQSYRLTEQSAPAQDAKDSAPDADTFDIPEPPPEVERGNISVDAVDVSTADALITDALAEALVMAEDRVIYTDGVRHGVINVDTLSAAFAPGETVDINRLKKKKLIAQDVGYLKVLARGSIDKPLTVYADDFSLGAIKMIALTGGRTFHVKSQPLP